MAHLTIGRLTATWTRGDDPCLSCFSIHIYIYMYVYSGMYIYIYIAKGILQKKHCVVFPAAFGRVSRRRSDKLKEFNALRDRISKDDVVSCFGHLA